MEGCSKERADVNLLSTAPGKRTLGFVTDVLLREHRATYPAAPGFWDSEEDHL